MANFKTKWKSFSAVGRLAFKAKWACNCCKLVRVGAMTDQDQLILGQGYSNTTTFTEPSDFWIKISYQHEHFDWAYVDMPMAYFYAHPTDSTTYLQVLTGGKYANQFTATIIWSSGNNNVSMNVAINMPNTSAALPYKMPQAGASAKHCQVVETDSHIITICRK